MNDSARTIRMIYRINPNHGLYDAIINNQYAGMQLEPTKPCYKPPMAKTSHAKNTEPKLTSINECAACFCPIREGTFIDGQHSRLHFCGKCGGLERPYNWQKPMVVLLATHIAWFLVLLFR
jgi:hypothetical protein